MKYIHKIDKRHNGYGQWVYYAKRPMVYSSSTSNYDAGQLFHKWFIWCWETWGPSKTLALWYEDLDLKNDVYSNAVAHNEHWCWEMDDRHQRIFFRTDLDFSLFLLRWK